MSHDTDEHSDGENGSLIHTDHDSLEDRDTGFPLRKPSKLPKWLDVFWNGPLQPRTLRVSLFAPRLQGFPTRLENRLSKQAKKSLVLLLWISWFVLNLTISKHGVLSTTRTEDKTPVPLLDCGWNEAYWVGPYADCGLDAELCTDKRVGQRLTFRCPGNCFDEGRTYKHWSVGNVTVMRQPVVVGGSDGVFRGDSFICMAALHAGLVSKYTGGCSELEWIGPHTGFNSTLSVDGKSESLSFDGDFPMNYRFVEPKSPVKSGCHDLAIPLMVVNAIYIFVAAYFLTSPRLFLGTLGTFGFWTVTLASNVPYRSGTPDLNNEFLSEAMARFLPFCLGLVYVYYFAAKPQLEKMPASLSRALFYGTGFLMGVFENYVFGSLPIDRLIISDLNAQPGAWLALIIIVSLVIAIAFGQAYGFWLTGQFKPYFKAYILGIAVIVALALLPGETLRVHHYILALALLPGTCLRTTPSLLYQGLLTGLYVSGVARWDFDSLLQTTNQLNRGDLAPSGSDPTDLVFEKDSVVWTGYPSEEFDAYAVLINDVERMIIPAEFHTSGAQSFNLSSWVAENDSPAPKWYIQIAAAKLHPPKLAKFSDVCEVTKAELEAEFYELSSI